MYSVYSVVKNFLKFGTFRLPQIIGEFQIRPDFYLPELDLYIEYWGMDTPQYKMSMYKKQMLYQQEGKRLISVYPQDLPNLNPLLISKLRLFGYNIDN